MVNEKDLEQLKNKIAELSFVKLDEDAYREMSLHEKLNYLYNLMQDYGYNEDLIGYNREQHSPHLELRILRKIVVDEFSICREVVISSRDYNEFYWDAELSKIKNN